MSTGETWGGMKPEDPIPEPEHPPGYDPEPGEAEENQEDEEFEE